MALLGRALRDQGRGSAAPTGWPRPAHGRDPRAPALRAYAHPRPSPAPPAGTPGCHVLITPEPTDLRAADPTPEHPPDSGPRQRRYASLRDGLRPPLTRPLRRALVLRCR